MPIGRYIVRRLARRLVGRRVVSVTLPLVLMFIIGIIVKGDNI